MPQTNLWVFIQLDFAWRRVAKLQCFVVLVSDVWNQFDDFLSTSLSLSVSLSLSD